MKKEIAWDTLEVDGIDYRDYPEFCDAYICYGEYTDGTEIEDEVLENLSTSDVLYNLIEKVVF